MVELRPLPTLPVDTIGDRWGEAVDAGFIAVPNVLIKAQERLGLSANDIVVLLNILMHWWRRDRLPSPRSSAIAKRSGLSHRTVQRSLGHLVRLGLISRARGTDRKFYYGLEGLRERLALMAREDVWHRPGLGRAGG